MPVEDARGTEPNLQVGGQVASFLTAHLGFPIASPAIFDQIGGRFRRAVASFAQSNGIPVVRFAKGDRKIEVMGPHLRAAAAGGVSRVAIGVAQEFASVFTGTRREGDGGGGVPWFSFAKADRRVTCYYFYLWDEDFGPAFVKVCSYFPYPMKIWVNGHEWAKQQASRAGSRSPRCRAGSPPAPTRTRCRESVTDWAQVRSGCSANGGGPACLCR